MKKTLIIFFIIIVFTLQGLAHTGQVDSNGGHYDYDTGEYHYHHGYDAHFHNDLFCEYDGYLYGEIDDSENESQYALAVIDEINAETRTLEICSSIFLGVILIFIAVLVILEVKSKNK